MRFENEYCLYFLLIIPLLIIAYVLIFYKKKKRWQTYCEDDLMKKLMPDHSKTMQHIKFSFLMAALTFFIIALANPQIGSSLEKGKAKGIDMMICIDVSNSMLAKDISPNRLEASKMALNRFVDNLHGDRVGIVAFAGKAFVQLPITNDYAAVKMFINYLNPDLIESQGTDVAAALDMAAGSMLPKDEKQNPTKVSRVIILVSDGEDHFPEAVEVAQQIHSLGITIHTIGIGSLRGAPIPDSRNNYKKDSEGNTVISKLNEAILRDVAQAGGGVYVHADNANMGFGEIQKKIDNMDKAELQEITFARYESKFQIPLIIGLVFLILDAFLFAVKPKWKDWFKTHSNFLSSKKVSVLAFLLLVSIPYLQAQTLDELSAIRRGNAKYEQAEKLRSEALQLMDKGGAVNTQLANQKLKDAAKLYQDAEIFFRKSIETTENYDKGNYNLANTLYRQEKYEDAADYFKSVADNTKSDKDLRAKSYHNMGNSYLKMNKYQESIDAYKKALKINPSDKETKYNLEYARKKMIQQQQQQQQNKDQQKDQKDQKDQKQNGGQNQQQQDQQQKQQQDQKQQQGQQGQQQKKEQQQKQQQQNKQQSAQKENDKRQLDALQQSERQTQKKVQEKQMSPGNKQKQEKDW